MSDGPCRGGSIRKSLGLNPGPVDLFAIALTHSSYAQKSPNNQRLEFLGDAVLGLLVADFLYSSYPDQPEGWLTERRAALVREESLAEAARDMGLGEYLLMGRGADESGDRNRNSVLADAFEALIGATYLSEGLAAARDVVMNKLRPKQRLKQNIEHDYKSRFQEKMAERGENAIEYRVIKETGPDHDKTFEVVLLLKGRKSAYGKGKTKKQAEQEAAKKAYLKLK